MTVIKKIGVERETLYLSSERGLCAVPFADLRTVKVVGNTQSVSQTGAVVIGYESRGVIVTVSFECKSVEEALKHKAAIDGLFVAEISGVEHG